MKNFGPPKFGLCFSEEQDLTVRIHFIDYGNGFNGKGPKIRAHVLTTPGGDVAGETDERFQATAPNHEEAAKALAEQLKGTAIPW